MVSLEITQLQHRLQSLEDPVGFLISLFSFTPVGFAIWKTDGHLLLVNKAFRELFGSEPPAGYNILKDEIAAERGVLGFIQRAFEGETTQLPTFWYDPRDLEQVTVTEGNLVAISMTVFPVLNRDGEIDFVAATYKDETEITKAQELLQAEGERLRQLVNQLEQEMAERERAEALATATEHRFRALTEKSVMPLNLLDADGNFIYVSPSAIRVVGFSPEEMIGKSAVSFMHPDEVRNKERPFERLLQNPGITFPVERRVLHKDGSWRWIDGFTTNLLDDPAVKAIVLNYRDITDRKQAQEEILQLNEALETRVRERTAELEAVNNELESFSYSVSHDLRAPLRAIGGFAQILAEDYRDQLDDEGQKYLGRIVDASKRMGELINDLLQLSRVIRSEIRRTSVNLSQMAESIAAALRETQPERVAKFIIASGLEVYADPHLMQIVLDNLLNNAWKYTSKHLAARIEFGTQEQDGQPVYFVRDDGVGFNMTYADKLFKPFQRLHSESEFEGSGIGLATVQRIISRHGGSAWAEGAVDGGATVYFTLPG